MPCAFDELLSENASNIRAQVCGKVVGYGPVEEHLCGRSKLLVSSPVYREKRNPRKCGKREAEIAVGFWTPADRKCRFLKQVEVVPEPADEPVPAVPLVRPIVEFSARELRERHPPTGRLCSVRSYKVVQNQTTYGLFYLSFFLISHTELRIGYGDSIPEERDTKLLPADPGCTKLCSGVLRNQFSIDAL